MEYHNTDNLPNSFVLDFVPKVDIRTESNNSILISSNDSSDSEEKKVSVKEDPDSDSDFDIKAEEKSTPITKKPTNKPKVLPVSPIRVGK